MCKLNVWGTDSPYPGLTPKVWMTTYTDVSLPLGIYKLGCILTNSNGCDGISSTSKEKFFLKAANISNYNGDGYDIPPNVRRRPPYGGGDPNLVECWNDPHYVQPSEPIYAMGIPYGPDDNLSILYVDNHSVIKLVYVTQLVDLLHTITIIEVPNASNVIISHDFDILSGMVYYCKWRFTSDDHYYSYVKYTPTFNLHMAGTYSVQLTINIGECEQIFDLPSLVVDTPVPINPIDYITIYLWRAYGYAVLRFFTADDWYRYEFTFDYAGIHDPTTGQWTNESIFRCATTPYEFKSDVVGTTGLTATYTTEYILEWESPYIEPITITNRVGDTITFKSPDWIYERRYWKEWNWDFGDGTISYITITIDDPHSIYPTFTKTGDENAYGEVTHTYTIFKEFVNETERDEYFTINPDQLVEGIHIKIAGKIRRYHLNRWNYPWVTLTVSNDSYTSSKIKGFE